MKHLLFILVWIVVQPALSCKKKDDPPVNWKSELPGSSWQGQFNYNSGSFVNNQPFSLSFFSTTFTWSEVLGDYTGVWTIDENNKITLKFDSGSEVSADIGKNSFSNIKNVTLNSGKISDVTLSSRIDPNPLINKIWTGTDNAKPMKFQFVSPTEIMISNDNGPWITRAFFNKGAAIYWSIGSTLDAHFGVFEDNGKTFRGIRKLGTASFVSWSVTK